jgi:hypothetical protein
VSGEWTRLQENASFAAKQLARFARELATAIDEAHQDSVAEQTVFLAADIALAASAALESRYPSGDRK